MKFYDILLQYCTLCNNTITFRKDMRANEHSADYKQPHQQVSILETVRRNQRSGCVRTTCHGASS